jgi:hypothetical protein
MAVLEWMMRKSKRRRYEITRIEDYLDPAAVAKLR